MEIVKFNSALGAEVRGVDLSKPMDAQLHSKLLNAWHDNLILLFRNQKISDGNLVDFSRLFGVLDVVPSSKIKSNQEYVTGLPEVAVISNVKENGVAIGGLGDGEASWHTDMSYIDSPPIGCVLFGVEIPEGQGNTYWANMYQAYEDLDDDVKDRIKDLNTIHDASYNSAGELREGYLEIASPTDVIGARHPIVRVHPETNKPTIYLGRRLNGYIEGLSLAESESLLDKLWEHCKNPKYRWCLEWRQGDVMMWDNRCTIHRRDSFDSSSRRILHRTQIRAAA